MKWPEFQQRFPGAKASTLRIWDGGKLGPVTWRVEFAGRKIEMPDKPGVLADIAELL